MVLGHDWPVAAALSMMTELAQERNIAQQYATVFGQYWLRGPAA